MRDVRDSAAAKSLSAYVILNRKGEHIATVRAHFANSGGVTVNVHNMGDAVTARTVRAMGYTLDDAGRIASGKAEGKWPFEVAGFQAGHASGYGYDKFTAALSGLWIDGHKMTNHCSREGARKPPKGRRTYPREFTQRGYSLANWDSAGDGYQSLYRAPGLEYLRALGYRVLQAV